MLILGGDYMASLGNILWYFPFLGFVNAIFTYLLGLVLTLTVVASPIGRGLMEYGKFLFAPFTRAMVSTAELGIQHNKLWQAYSTIVRIIYTPFGIFLAVLAVFQIAGLFISIVGIPAAVVLAKSLGTYFNPVNKKCVSQKAAEELQRRKAVRELDKFSK
ncbi:MAG: YccF domain-containing protein [Nanopusillaceae archaeon]